LFQACRLMAYLTVRAAFQLEGIELERNAPWTSNLFIGAGRC
jgi:hypothetical protein